MKQNINNSLFYRDKQPCISLCIEGLSVYATKFESGHSRQVTISFRVVNTGEEAITTPFRSSVFPGDIKLDSLRPVLDTYYMNIAGLAAGQTVYVSRTIIVPSEVSEFDIRVEIDAGHTITGSDRTNNIVTSHFKNPTPDVGRWISIGPRRINDGGLGAVGVLFSIAIDPTNPSIVYVGSHHTSGVWKTSDGGSSWQPITDSLPTLAIAAIAIDPSVSSRVYIVTPDYGVFRSEDTGTSWIQLDPNWVPSNVSLNLTDCCDILLVHPTNSNVLYLTSNNGVYRSSDSGTTWQLSLGGGQATALIIDPSNPNVLYAGIYGRGIYKTINGGVPLSTGENGWTLMTGGLPSSDIQQVKLALCCGTPSIVYALFRRSFGFQLYRTTNAGASWSLRSSPTFYIAVLGVDPINPNIVYLSGVDFYRSDTGGANFNPKTGPHVDHHGFATDPVSPSIIYTVCDGGIYRSTNRGDVWSFIGEGIVNVEFYDIAHAVTQPNLIIGGTQDNGTLRYDGNSTVWNEILGGDGATVDIDPTNERILYAMNQYASSIQRSANGGGSWTNIASGLPTGPVCFNLNFHVHPTIPTTLLASCGSLWRTAMPGSPWSPILSVAVPPGSRPVNIVRSAVDPTINLYYAGTDRGDLFAGHDGTNWQEVFTHPSNLNIIDIEIDLDDPAIVYVVFGGTDTGRVYRLRRTSLTPTNMIVVDITFNLPRGLLVRTVAVDRMTPLTIYVGTNRGVYRGRSTDGGAIWSWTPYNNGLPLADVVDLEVHPITGVMRAATFGRSVFEVNTDYSIGSLLAAEGKVTFLRVHDMGTGFGPPTDFIDVEAVIMLNSQPGKAFGFQLRNDTNESTRRGMLDLLRNAFNDDRRVRIDYVRTGLHNGRILRVVEIQ